MTLGLLWGDFGVTLGSLWADFGVTLDKQVEINAHYLGYLNRQAQDINAYKKDESLLIPKNFNYDSLSGLSNEIKSKLNKIRPNNLAGAIRSKFNQSNT